MKLSYCKTLIYLKMILLFLSLHTAAAFAQGNFDIRQVAESISAGVGQVANINTGASAQTLIIFEETHTSISGQIEIAMMLNRLYRDHQLRDIALEGAFASDGVLKADWFNKLGKAADPGLQKEIAVQLLQEGEINSAEWMAMVFPSVRVFGVENAREYSIELSEGATTAINFYLIAIAERSLTQAQIIEINRLIEDNQIEKALGKMLDANTFTREHSQLLTQQERILSAEEMRDIATRIKRRAEAVGANIKPEQRRQMDEIIQFYDTASIRSHTMVREILAKARPGQRSLVAFLTGAAHTAEIERILKQKDVAYAVITPKSLGDRSDSFDMSYKLFLERKTKQLPLDTTGVGQILINKKPRPVIDQLWFKAKAEMYYATALIAHAAKEGELPPFTNVQSQMDNLEFIKINYGSMAMDGNDVIFQVTANTDKVRTFWVKTAQVIDQPSRSDDVETLLNNALEAVKTQSGGGGNNIVVGNKRVTNPNPDPGKKVMLKAISQDSIAAFAPTKTAVKQIKISG